MQLSVNQIRYKHSYQIKTTPCGWFMIRYQIGAGAYTRQTSIHSAPGQARSSSAIVSRTALWSVPAAG